MAAIAPMLTISRLHNAAAAVSYMRRVTALASDYARRRRVFGRRLCAQPLAVRRGRCTGSSACLKRWLFVLLQRLGLTRLRALPC